MCGGKEEEEDEWILFKGVFLVVFDFIGSVTFISNHNADYAVFILNQIMLIILQPTMIRLLPELYDMTSKDAREQRQYIKNLAYGNECRHCRTEGPIFVHCRTSEQKRQTEM